MDGNDVFWFLIFVSVLALLIGGSWASYLTEGSADSEWAYRSTCDACKIIESRKHLDGSQFWSKPCPKCGEKMIVKLCRDTVDGPEFK